MSARKFGWMLALMWGAIAVSMLIVGWIQEDTTLLLCAILPAVFCPLLMWWAEVNV